MQQQRAKKTGLIPHATCRFDRGRANTLPQRVDIKRASAAGAAFHPVSGLESRGEYPAGKGIAVHDVVNQNHETTGAETLLHDRSPCMLPSCL
jgi:hypothetical protein